MLPSGYEAIAICSNAPFPFLTSWNRPMFSSDVRRWRREERCSTGNTSRTIVVSTLISTYADAKSTELRFIEDESYIPLYSWLPCVLLSASKSCWMERAYRGGLLAKVAEHKGLDPVSARGQIGAGRSETGSRIQASRETLSAQIKSGVELRTDMAMKELAYTEAVIR